MESHELIVSLKQELKLPLSDRDTRASDSSLQFVIDLLQRADKSVNAGQSELAAELLQSASRQVSDSWSFRSTLSGQIIQLAISG